MSHVLPTKADVVIVGGGPAGSVCAALLRRRDPDRSVVVIEKSASARHHVGESLIAGIAPVLARAGILAELEARADRGDGMVRKAGIAFHWGADDGTGAWTADLRAGGGGPPPPASYHVDRARFDALLLDHARDLGAEVLRGATVVALEEHETGHRVRLEQGEQTHTLDADFLVDASGLARVVSRLRGERRIGFDDMSNYAVYGYWRGSKKKELGAPLPPGTFWTFVATTQDGWCWHIPLADDLVSVGLVTTRDALPRGGSDALEHFYVENVRAAEGLGPLLADARLDRHPSAPAGTRLHVERDWSSHAERLSGPRHVLIGDAALFVDPILTSGVVLSVLGASLAASLLHTRWTDAEADLGLLHTSFEETYLDLALGYHRVAQIWYRRNDKVASWWWQARKAALRAGTGSLESDARAFLAMALGLVRDPFAGQAEHRASGLDLIRPDKLLLAHGVLGGHRADTATATDPSLIDRALLHRLTEITRRHGDEGEARDAVRRHLLERWRARLARPLSLAHLEIRARDRYYADRTMDAWRRTRLVEVRRRGATDLLDRVVLPLGTDPSAPLGIALDAPTLRVALEAASEPFDVGSREERALHESVFDRLAQLDAVGLLDEPPLPLADAVDVRSREDALELLRALVPRLLGELPRYGLVIDLLGRSLEILVPTGAAAHVDWLLVPHEDRGRRPRRAYAQTSTLSVSYVGGTLTPDARAALDVRLERLREDERAGRVVPPIAALRALLGTAWSVDGARASETSPERLRAARGPR